MSSSGDARRPLFEIERENASRIWLQFAALLATLFVGAWVACLIVSVFLFVLLPVYDTYTWVFTLRGAGLIFAVTLLLATAYWYISRIGARERLLRAMHCVPLDPDDRYHQRLANVVEEIRLATGGPPIDVFTVPTLGLNAFSFSDLKGGGVIGVTEGALARLSRQQLQAVVAHEFGHILSGSYVTVTVSCLLFGVYTSLGEQMESATDGAAESGSAASLGVVALLLRGWLWVVQLASSLTDAALSRDRERQADLAAARFTRDPLSLAAALRVIAEHPGGAGSIPEGLAPLCIRDAQSQPTGFLAAWRRTHPPLEERIATLLRLANVSPGEFRQHAETATENFDRREHWSPAPSARAVSPASAVLAAVADASAVPGSGSARPVSDLAELASLGKTTRLRSAHSASCPACGVALRAIDYEGKPVYVCGSCGGCLVEGAALRGILARREVGFTDEQRRLAEEIAVNGDQRRRAARAAQGASNGGRIACPCCGKTMLHRHFSYEHALDVDRCVICDVVWFRRDELEVLQLLTERQVD